MGYFNRTEELKSVSRNFQEERNKGFKIIIADDHGVVRRGIANIINENWERTSFSFADSFDQAVVKLNESADLLILDINMPGGNKFTMVDEARRLQPNIKILIFSSYNESIYAGRYLQAGANGYLQKNSEEPEIVNAIGTVLAGKKYVSNQLKDSLVDAFEESYFHNKNPINSLSNRELEIGMLLVSGSGVLEISNKLNIQMGTVSTYKGRIFDKLRVKSVVELVGKFQLYQ